MPIREQTPIEKLVDAVFGVIRWARKDDFDPDEIMLISIKDFNKLSNAFTDYTHEEMIKTVEQDQKELLLL